MSKVATITGSGQITVPSAIRKQLNIETGHKLLVTQIDDMILMKPLQSASSILDLHGSINSKETRTVPVETAIEQAKAVKAHKTIEQEYEI